MKSYDPRYTSYFQVLIDELREDHNFTNAHCPRPNAPYYAFSSGFMGIKYVAGFYVKGPYRGQKAYTELLINFGDYLSNKSFFDTLKERESKIAKHFDDPLYWNRRDDIKSSVIYIDHDGNIEFNEKGLEALRACHIANLRQFKEVFTPEIVIARQKRSF